MLVSLLYDAYKSKRGALRTSFFAYQISGANTSVVIRAPGLNAYTNISRSFMSVSSAWLLHCHDIKRHRTHHSLVLFAFLYSTGVMPLYFLNTVPK